VNANGGSRITTLTICFRTVFVLEEGRYLLETHSEYERTERDFIAQSSEYHERIQSAELEREIGRRKEAERLQAEAERLLAEQCPRKWRKVALGWNAGALQRTKVTIHAHLLLAGRALGYEGYGGRSSAHTEFEQSFPRTPEAN